jgi:DNA-binding transcriptional LysR family regulator
MIQQWQGVSEFLAVADSGNFTRAAEDLGISTAQVSRQIRILEKRLGIDLFYRTTRRVSLTEAGQIYYQSCRPLLDALSNAERAVNQLQSVPQGLIRITAPVTYGERHLAPLLNQFLTLYPEISLYCELTNKTLDIIAGNYDLAVRLGRIESQDLVARRLGNRRLFTCASPDYLRRHGKPETPDALHSHTCMPGTLDYWRFHDAGGERMMKVDGRLRCNSGDALLDAARRGLGIIQLPDYYVEPALQSGELVEVLEKFAPPDDGIWALYPPGRQLSLKVSMLLDYLSEHLNPE